MPPTPTNRSEHYRFYPGIDDAGHQDGIEYPYEDFIDEPMFSSEPPKVTLPQKAAMDEFVESPSQDQWIEIVEEMRRARKEQDCQQSETILPIRTNSRRNWTRSRQKGGRSTSQMGSSPSTTEVELVAVRTDQPIESEDDPDNVGGWTMHAVKSRDDENEQASDQSIQSLESMLNHSSARPSDDGEDTATYPSSCSLCSFVTSKAKSPKSPTCNFLLGFLIGTILVLGFSFTFDWPPSEEPREISLRVRTRQPSGEVENVNGTEININGTEININGTEINDMEGQEKVNEVKEVSEALEGILTSDTSQDEVTSYVSQYEEEAEADLTNFCGSCHWKNSPFDCKGRVKWEMKHYNITEDVAKRANLKHCTMPTSIDEIAVNETSVEEGGS